MIGHKAQEIAELRVALAESEAREQRLKETMESIIPLINTGSPVPKEGNHD